MTITYSLDVANTRFCGFAKLLKRWKGSIYKILWKEFLVFAAGYTTLSIIYRCYLDASQKVVFENVVKYFETFIDVIPLSFVLGFYVSLVIGRWWNQFEAIPWPDRLCYLIATYVHGADERSRIIRRSLGRYLILMQALTFQGVSTAVKKRFPTTQHFVMAGFMTNEERTVFENVDVPYGKWWLPGQWFSALAMRARKEGRIKDSVLLHGILQEYIDYRSTCGSMFSYDWISVPLVYTQVVTLATYVYAFALMVGRQYLDPSKNYQNHQVDLYVPMFALVQFFFYVGWLKIFRNWMKETLLDFVTKKQCGKNCNQEKGRDALVAEQIVNPYGEDDDDFELNWCLDRSCQVVYLLVDHFHTKHPKLRKDAFWDQLLPQLPQTKFSANFDNPQLGSAFNLEVNPVDSEFLPMDKLLEEENDANIYNSISMKHSNSIRYRPSFLMKFLNSNLGQSIRKRSMNKSESFREVRGHSNPAFAIGEKSGTITSNSSSNSRKSSFTTKKSSPSDSRTSSLSFHPGVTSRHRQKPYDLQQPESNLANGVTHCNEETQRNSIVSVLATGIAPVVANFEDICNKSTSIEPDAGHQKIDSYMPPIPEEPASRVVSLASLDSDAASSDSPKQLDDVQTLVAEASKVLEELNKVVRAGGHKKECESKGYESCCSLDTEEDESSEDENEIQSLPEAEAQESSDCITVDVPKASENDNEPVSSRV